MDECDVPPILILGYYAKCFMDILGTSHLRDRHDFLGFPKEKTSIGRGQDLVQAMKTADRGARNTT